MDSAEAEASYEALEKYGIDLIALAEKGKLDPVIGRDEEINRGNVTCYIVGERCGQQCRGK